MGWVNEEMGWVEWGRKGGEGGGWRGWKGGEGVTLVLLKGHKPPIIFEQVLDHIQISIRTY